MDEEIETLAHDRFKPAHAFQAAADGLPALGIVAAVLGIIHAMGALDQSPEALGGLIGAALVGTFAGIFLAYAVVGPIAQKMKGVRQKQLRLFTLVKQSLLAAIKTMLFTFNDLPRLSERARALLFDRASIDVVVMALRGTDADFRNAILSSMPSRGRRLVEGELASGAAAPPREVAKARKAIADIVLGMAARNEIELGGAREAAA